MIRRTLLLLGFGLVLSVGAFAQAFTVSYLDGTTEIQTAKGWKVLSIGDQVPADATVRLSQESSLELQRGKVKITLLKNGTYALPTLAKAADATTAGVGGAIAQKLSGLVTEKPKTSAAGGVRGADQSGGSVTWVDESDEARTQIQSLLDSKKYADAVQVLDSAIADASTDADQAEFTYLLGVAYYGNGQTAKAYRALQKVDASADVEWYARFIILKAQVLVDSASFQDALDVLTPFITSYPTGEATQVAWLLTGISQKGLQDTPSARKAFDTGYKLDPATDTAKLIDQQRKGL
jgi:tetratricopeptide (TPR) repeat protein